MPKNCWVHFTQKITRIKSLYLSHFKQKSLWFLQVKARATGGEARMTASSWNTTGRCLDQAESHKLKKTIKQNTFKCTEHQTIWQLLWKCPDRDEDTITSGSHTYEWEHFVQKHGRKWRPAVVPNSTQKDWVIWIKSFHLSHFKLCLS